MPKLSLMVIFIHHRFAEGIAQGLATSSADAVSAAGLIHAEVFAGSLQQEDAMRGTPLRAKCPRDAAQRYAEACMPVLIFWCLLDCIHAALPASAQSSGMKCTCAA